MGAIKLVATRATPALAARPIHYATGRDVQVAVPLDSAASLDDNVSVKWSIRCERGEVMEHIQTARADRLTLHMLLRPVAVRLVCPSSRGGVIRRHRPYM